MAIQKITTGAKQSGQIMSAQMYNDIIDCINANADVLSAQGTQMSGLSSQTSSNTEAIVSVVSRLPVRTVHTGSGTSSSPITIMPGVLNVWGETGQLYVSLGGTAAASDIMEYMLEFTVLGTSFSLNLDDTVKWVGGDVPDWEPGYTYQVSIERGLAIAAGWPPATT